MVKTKVATPMQTDATDTIAMGKNESRQVTGGSRRVYRCAHCPLETERCVKVVTDEYTECIE